MKSIDSWTLDNFSISREFDSQKKGGGGGWRRNYAIETSNRAASVRPCLAGQHLSLDKSSRNPPLPFSSIHQGELLSFVTAMNCRFLPHCYVIIISVSDYNRFSSGCTTIAPLLSDPFTGLSSSSSYLLIYPLNSAERFSRSINLSLLHTSPLLLAIADLSVYRFEEPRRFRKKYIYLLLLAAPLLVIVRFEWIHLLLYASSLPPRLNNPTARFNFIRH